MVFLNVTATTREGERKTRSTSACIRLSLRIVHKNSTSRICSHTVHYFLFSFFFSQRSAQQQNPTGERVQEKAPLSVSSATKSLLFPRDSHNLKIYNNPSRVAFPENLDFLMLIKFFTSPGRSFVSLRRHMYLCMCVCVCVRGVFSRVALVVNGLLHNFFLSFSARFPNIFSCNLNNSDLSHVLVSLMPVSWTKSRPGMTPMACRTLRSEIYFYHGIFLLFATFLMTEIFFSSSRFFSALYHMSALIANS